MNEEDELRLRMLLEHQVPPPFPDSGQSAGISRLLAALGTSAAAPLGRHVGFHDLVTLEAADDRTDSFRFAIVMPREEDVDADHISVLHPLGLAVLGRKHGDAVSWETPSGIRRMRIVAIEKSRDFVLPDAISGNV